MKNINGDFNEIYSKEEINFIKKFESIKELKEHYLSLRLKGYNIRCVGTAENLVGWLSPGEYKRLSEDIDFYTPYTGLILNSPSGKSADLYEIRQFIKKGKFEFGNKTHLEIINLYGLALVQEYLNWENMFLISEIEDKVEKINSQKGLQLKLFD